MNNFNEINSIRKDNKILAKYKNGNYDIEIYNDGTKIREGHCEEFIADFPELIDLKITNICRENCLYCYEDSKINSEYSISDSGFLVHPFLDTLIRGTEIVISGGDPLLHQKLIKFLKKMKNQGVICSITVHQKSCKDKLTFVKKLSKQKLIYGINVSIEYYDEELINELKKIPNIVLYLINGITEYEIIKKLFDNNFKISFLGYKEYGKSEIYYNKNKEMIMKNQKDISDNLQEIVEHFEIVTFDNLALEQLNVKKILTTKKWDRFFMSEDGKFTMYIDLVKKEFAKSSISKKRYKLRNNIKNMFRVIKI